MKKNSTLLGGALVALLAAGLQAYAQDPTFTSTPQIYGSGALDYTSPTPLSTYGFTLADSGYNLNITSGFVTVDIHEPYGQNSSVWLVIDGYASSSQTAHAYSTTDLTFNLDTTYNSGNTAYGQDVLNYIKNEGTSSFSYTVDGDCYLTSAELSVNSSGPDSAPDGGSTVMLLGGVLTALGLMKRKMMA